MEISDLQKLAGITNNFQGYKAYEGSNISITGTEKKRIEREKGIEPGTDDWFKLWFTVPGLTGPLNQQPGFRGRKK